MRCFLAEYLLVSGTHYWVKECGKIHYDVVTGLRRMRHGSGYPLAARETAADHHQ